MVIFIGLVFDGWNVQLARQIRLKWLGFELRKSVMDAPTSSIPESRFPVLMSLNWI
jgi:hypothetical protein